MREKLKVKAVSPAKQDSAAEGPQSAEAEALRYRVYDSGPLTVVVEETAGGPQRAAETEAVAPGAPLMGFIISLPASLLAWALIAYAVFVLI